MKLGTVREYNDSKGVGYIDPDDGGSRVFVSWNKLDRNILPPILYVGQKVKYNSQGSALGEVAIYVCLNDE